MKRKRNPHAICRNCEYGKYSGADQHLVFCRLTEKEIRKVPNCYCSQHPDFWLEQEKAPKGCAEPKRKGLWRCLLDKPEKPINECITFRDKDGREKDGEWYTDFTGTLLWRTFDHLLTFYPVEWLDPESEEPAPEPLPQSKDKTYGGWTSQDGEVVPNPAPLPPNPAPLPPNPVAAHPRRIAFLLFAEKLTLERMIANLPESSVIDRMSFEARKAEVEEELTAMSLRLLENVHSAFALPPFVEPTNTTDEENDA